MVGRKPVAAAPTPFSAAGRVAENAWAAAAPTDRSAPEVAGLAETARTDTSIRVSVLMVTSDASLRAFKAETSVSMGRMGLLGNSDQISPSATSSARRSQTPSTIGNAPERLCLASAPGAAVVARSRFPTPAEVGLPCQN